MERGEYDIHRINARDYGLAQDRSRIMIVGFRKDLAGVFRMPPKFPGLGTNMGDVLRDLMSANAWNGAEDWVRMIRELPEFDRVGNPIGVGALSDTIRGYQGSPKKGEARRALENGVSYAPPAKAAPTNEEASKEGFLPGFTTACVPACGDSRMIGNSLAVWERLRTRLGMPSRRLAGSPGS